MSVAPLKTERITAPAVLTSFRSLGQNLPLAKNLSSPSIYNLTAVGGFAPKFVSRHSFSTLVSSRDSTVTAAHLQADPCLP